MKSLRRIAALFLVAGATLAGSMAMNPSDAVAGGVTINCVVPSYFSCSISHPDGIKSVKVSTTQGDYVYNLVDKAYAGCPRNVHVMWEGAVPPFALLAVETCTSVNLTNGNPPGAGSKTTGIVSVLPASGSRGYFLTKQPAPID